MDYHVLLTGKIHFVSTLADDDLTDVSFYISDKAISNRLIANLGYNLTEGALIKYPHSINYLKGGYIPYEIINPPWFDECYNVFGNIGYSIIDRTVNIDKSRVPDVQKFLTEIIVHELISYLTLDLDDVHGYPQECYEGEIKANQFCQTILDFGYNFEGFKLKITK